MLTWLRMSVARLRVACRVDDLDRDFDREVETHLAMAEADKIRRGMTPAEARRAARVELGGLSQLREANREMRGIPWIGTVWLDVKLGVRMLRKSWGLTLVGGLAMTVVIAIATGTFSVVQVELGSTLPLDEGDRVVALMVQDPATTRRQEPSHLDFERWRASLTSVEAVGAFRTIERNLGTANGPTGEPVSIAVMTASGFQLARVPPLLGRPLVEDDEHPGAVPVVVIGYDVWQSRFGSDPTVVGQQVRLGGVDHTVVGVMPEGFAFPVNHQFWTPLPAAAGDDPGEKRPTVFAFARLAPGVTEEAAEAELTAVGLLPVPETSEQVTARRLRVVPYPLALTVSSEADEYFARLSLILIALLLVPPCANVAILVYARTVTRQEEFAARYALGATRGRLVAQLFVETLVLAVGAAGLALGLLRLFYVLEPFTGPNDPFWRDYGVSVTTMLFAGVLAVFAALIAGMLPAFQATGRLAVSGLHTLGGRTSMRLGATWTALVVAQIAFSVAVLPSAVEYGWGMMRPGVLGPGFAAEEYLTARLMMDPATSPSLDDRHAAERVGARHAELSRLLEAEAGVAGVTMSVAVPGAEPWAFVEVDEPDGRPGPEALSAEHLSHVLVEFNRVDHAFFDLFDVPLLSGRRFETGDFEPGRTGILVNRTFGRDIAGNGNPLGYLVRYATTTAGPASEPGLWFEIVGVVDDLPANAERRRVYHPLTPGQIQPLSLTVRVTPVATGLANRLAELTVALDPRLRIDQIQSLAEIYRRIQLGNSVLTIGLGAVILSILLLSAAGLYALMSFTVNRRRREIGIRSALGAQAGQLLNGIFKRVLSQVAAGAGVGILAAIPLNSFLSMAIEDMQHANIPGVIPAAAGLMMVVGVLAAAGPARRGLRIEPTEALRDG